MKQISQAEFESLVEILIDGKITRKKLAKGLDTDIRTLNNKITELSIYNPELYEKYVQKFPYRPKTRRDIDFEALVIYAMKNSKTLDEIAEEYQVSRRTVARRIKEMEKTNPELFNLYREYADSLKKRSVMSLPLQERIDNLVSSPVALSTNIEVKENELRVTLQRFEELLSQGISKAEAARTLGYDDYPTIWKKEQELKRIESERKVMAQQDDSESKRFRHSMRIDSKVATNANVAKKDTSTQNKVKEGR